MTVDSGYRDRSIERVIETLATELSALTIVGPRAIGKTTTVERRARTVIRLNVPAEAAAFEADPDAALLGLEEPVMLDEWQAVPGVLGAVARSVNDNPGPDRFFLTGSVRAKLENTLWPGTGRLQRLVMYPMTVRELQGLGSQKSFLDKVIDGDELTVPAVASNLRDYVELALTGGFPYPALTLQSTSAKATWFDSYVNDLLTHDIEQAADPDARGRDPVRLRRYVEAYALNSSGVLDHKKIYDAAGIRRETANAYEELLQRLFVIDKVDPWATNRLSRLVHQAKRYVVDPALMAHLLRIDSNGVMADGDILGRLLDTFVAAQLRPEIALSGHRPRLYHLRTEGGRHEVDLIVELGGDRVVGVEVKAAAAPDRADAKHLFWLRDELGDRFLRGVVLHTGPRVFELGERVLAVPISAIWTP